MCNSKYVKLLLKNFNITFILVIIYIIKMKSKKFNVNIDKNKQIIYTNLTIKSCGFEGGD